jgi:hypothetical protein
MYRIIIGRIGSDAGYWYIGPDGKLHHVPGWDPEGLAELGAAVNIMREATRLKAPGLAEAAIKSVMDFTQKELASHLKQGQGSAGEGVVLVLG